jgi:hypothetical protein
MQEQLLETQSRADKTTAEVTANFLPSPDQYRQPFQRAQTLGDVKTAVMAFFGVSDFKDRDTHTFHLMFEGQQRDDLGTTLQALLGDERDTAHFQLVERIQAG